MEELEYTRSEVQRIKITGFCLGMIVGALFVGLLGALVLALTGPASAATRTVPTSCSETTFTFNHKTGDVTVRAQKVFDPTPIYKFRFGMANDKGWITFDDYPKTDVGHFTSTYTRNISTLHGGHLWALIAFRGSDACGKGVMFGGVA